MASETGLRARLAASPDATDPLAMRAHRFREALGPCLGAPPDGLTIAPPPEPAPMFPTLRAPARVRMAIQEAAQEVLDGVISWEIERLEAHMAPRVRWLWADGSSGVYEAPALLRALEQRGGKSAPLLPRDLRTYLPGEWRAILPRGYAALYAELVDDRTAVAITAALDGRGGSVGRALLFAAPDGAGDWRILCGPLPSPDDAAAASARTSLDEDEGIRVADRAVRRWCLGQGRALEAMRNDLADQIRFEGAWVPALEWAARAEAVDPDAASWTVFEGTRPEPDGTLARDEQRVIEREAKRFWRGTWDRLRPRWMVARVSRWDPAARKTTEPRDLRVLVLRYEDEDARGERRERWRLGGFWPG